LLTSRICKGRNQQGEACGSPPLREGEFCWSHDPENAEAAQEARRVGGIRRRREGTVAAAYDFEGLDTIPKVRRLLEVAVADTLSLENSIARSRALAYLAQVAVMLLEKGEHEERLEAIEAVLGPRLMKPDSRRRRL
jgi:hypothetical protein